jgi:hypothetical protein
MAEKVVLEKIPNSRFDKFNRTKAALIGVTLLLVLSLISTGYFYKKYDAIKKNPQKVAQDETKVVIAAVSQLIELPQGEDPTVATVTDLAPLKGQAFFVNAKIGDKVLIFAKAAKAILYDPNANKIVEVAPINIGAGANGTAPATTGTGTTRAKQ